MLNLIVIVGSTREGRKSIDVAHYVAKKFSERAEVKVELVDLEILNLPMMKERLRFQKNPPDNVVAFSKSVSQAHAIVIVSPEYNHGYPGVLKNALDYLLPEYEGKPFGLVTVSAGGFGGIHCLEQLRLIALALGGYPIPQSFTVSKVQDVFESGGNLKDVSYEKRFQAFAEGLLTFTKKLNPNQ